MSGDKYLVVYEWAGENYSAYLPDIPGCVATGATKREVREHIRSALDGYLRAVERDHISLDDPKSFAEEISTPLIDTHSD